MANNNLQTSLTIRANVQGQEQVARLSHSVDGLSDELVGVSRPATTAQSAIDGLGDEMTDTTESANKMSGVMGGLKTTLGGLSGLLAGLGITMGAKELLDMSAAFATLEANIKMTTGEGANFISAMDGIKQVADSTNTNLTETGNLFNKLATSTKEMNLSQQDLLGVTKTINQAVKLSGQSAESSAAALQQLSQGLAGGVLRGDEFNSVMEQAFPLAQAMADGLGVTIGQLRAMANEGQLTSEVVVGALQKQAVAIDERYRQLPVTIGDAITGVQNELMSFVGGLDKELGGSNAIANFIKELQTNLANIDPAAIDSLKLALSSLGEIVSTVWGGVSDVIDAFATLGNLGEEDKLSLITQQLRQIAFACALLSDGIKAVMVGGQVMIGGLIKLLGELRLAWDTLRGKPTEAAHEMIKAGELLKTKAFDMAQTIGDKTAAAFDNMGKTTKDRLNEVAHTAHKSYTDLLKSGTATAGQLEQAFVEYAKAHIKANDNVIDKTLQRQLAENNLQAVVDKTGQITITATDTAKAGIDGVTDSLGQASNETAKLNAQFGEFANHSDAFKKLGLDIGEFTGGLSTKAAETIEAFNQIGQVGSISAEQLATAYAAAKKAVGDNKLAQDALYDSLVKNAQGNQALIANIDRLAQTQAMAKLGADIFNKTMADGQKTQTTNTKATTDNTKAVSDNTATKTAQNQSVADNSAKLAENTKAQTDNTTATDQNSQSQSRAMAFGQALLAMINRTGVALKDATNDTKQMGQAFEYFKTQVFRGGVGGFRGLFDKIAALDKMVKQSVANFKAQEQAVANASASLQKADVSTQELAKAQSVLNSATQFSIAGIIKLDKAKLDSLRQQIDSTKQKLDNLADTARQTRENLESELARIQGNEDKARQIEQQQKLKALEKQLKDAQKRGNGAEISELQQALNLQRQIFAEQQRQAQIQKQQQKQAEQTTAQAPSLPNQSSQDSSDLSKTATELTDIWQAQIENAKKQGASEFARQLMLESKRRAN